MFQYGGYDYSSHCEKLDIDKDTKEKMCYSRECKFDEEGNISETGVYEISGWVAIARHSNDLDEKNDGQDDNLNNVSIVVREKVAQEDILHEYRLGGMITKYIFGEIYANFLDDDNLEDIATSGRQKIIENDPRYIALKLFIGNELKYIWSKTNKLKEKKGVETALAFSPHIEKWYNSLNKNLKESAGKIFGEIEKISVDPEHRKTLYVNGILAFEKLKVDHAMGLLEKIDESNVDALLSVFSEVDDIESGHYYEITIERLRVIDALRKQADENAVEKALQEYVFEHLWLLDPAWERATEDKNMEKSIQKIVDEMNEKERGKNTNIRTDIRYRKLTGEHVIIELKRHDRRLMKTDIEKQLDKYIKAVKKELNIISDRHKELVEGICIVGQLPIGWDNRETRKNEEDSLKPLGIRVITYKELINNAYSAYSKYTQASEKVGEIRELIKNIRNIENPE